MVDLLLNEKSVLLSFFAENKKQELFTRTVNDSQQEEVSNDFIPTKKEIKSKPYINDNIISLNRNDIKLKILIVLK